MITKQERFVLVVTPLSHHYLYYFHPLFIVLLEYGCGFSERIRSYVENHGDAGRRFMRLIGL